MELRKSSHKLNSLKFAGKQFINGSRLIHNGEKRKSATKLLSATKILPARRSRRTEKAIKKFTAFTGKTAAHRLSFKYPHGKNRWKAQPICLLRRS